MSKKYQENYEGKTAYTKEVIAKVVSEFGYDQASYTETDEGKFIWLFKDEGAIFFNCKKKIDVTNVKTCYGLLRAVENALKEKHFYVEGFDRQRGETIFESRWFTTVEKAEKWFSDNFDSFQGLWNGIQLDIMEAVPADTEDDYDVKFVKHLQ